MASSNGIGRRAFLAAAVGLALPLSGRLAPALAAIPQTAPQRRLSLENLHTGERLSTTYWSNGAYLPAALREIDVLLRDHRANAIHPMAPGLIDLLFDLRQALATEAPLQIISGYRAPATNAILAATGGGGVASGSLHMRGEAIDIRVPGRPSGAVRDAALKLRRGGVGFYPKSDFVHLDIGRVRAW